MTEPAKPRKVKIDPQAFKMLRAGAAIVQRAQGELQLALVAILAAHGIKDPVTVDLEEPSTLILKSLPPAAPGS